MNGLSKKLIFYVSLLLWVLALSRVGLTANETMWDFEQYYYVAKADAAGLNSFRPEKTEKFIRKWESDTWLYPYFPPSVYFFRVFTYLPLNTSKYVYLFLKCIVLGYLFYMWQCAFLRDPGDPYFLVFCLFAFNATVYLDMRSGNVNLIEQAFLWTAFYFFVRGKLAFFCALLLVSSMWKITPLVFSFLLLLGRRDRSVAFFFLATIVVVLALSLLVYRSEIGSFLSTAHQLARGLPDENIKNLSSLALIRSSIAKWSSFTGISLPWMFGILTYVLFVIIVGIASWQSLRRLDMENSVDRETAICLSCSVYAVTLPLFQDYQFILMLVPAYSLTMRLDLVKAFPVLFACFVLSARSSSSPGSIVFLDVFWDIFWNYYSLLVAFLVWILYISWIRKTNSV
ncbi:MAG TPA: glycosyltransferase family 87 protein [Desulfomonilaceae bacterium]|nr:glycosyltransferase family 87 protein [Desulfomonilaceae bacterium]